MKHVAVFGASGCGKGVMPLVRKAFDSESAVSISFVDDQVRQAKLNGYPVYTYDQWIKQCDGIGLITVAIADCVTRSIIVERCFRDGLKFLDVQASNVVVMDNVEVGIGAILCPFVTLTSNIRIGKHFHANLYSYVEHDCVIGDFVTFAPGVKCNGNVIIEDFVYIGAGAIIRQGRPGRPLVIGRGAVVGMGAVVTKDVPAGLTVIGNPARPLLK